MQRFFLPNVVAGVDAEVSLAPIHNQLVRVLRVQPGSQLLILDNAGSERLLEIMRVDRREAVARVVEIRPALLEPAIPVTLYQSILKIDKFELVLQKATELGVTTFVPVISRRTVARPGAALTNKQTRWESIVREAAEQSGRGGLPVVAPVCTFEEAIANAKQTRLLPWEAGAGSMGLLTALTQRSEPVESVSILIGPEGGFEAEEVDAAQKLGWQIVSLGARILRAETAAIAALSLVTATLGGLGDAPSVTVSSVPDDEVGAVGAVDAAPKKSAKRGSKKANAQESDTQESDTEESSVASPTVAES